MALFTMLAMDAEMDVAVPLMSPRTPPVAVMTLAMRRGLYCVSPQFAVSGQMMPWTGIFWFRLFLFTPTEAPVLLK